MGLRSGLRRGDEDLPSRERIFNDGVSSNGYEETPVMRKDRRSVVKGRMERGDGGGIFVRADADAAAVAGALISVWKN